MGHAGARAFARQWARDLDVRDADGLPGHFEMLGLYVGSAALIINYRDRAGGVACEILTSGSALVREGRGARLTRALIRLP